MSGIRIRIKPDGSQEIEKFEVEKAPDGKPKDYIDPESIRLLRDRLLSSSDWTQVADAPVDQEAWREYRQQLRDITSQDGFPEKIYWPESPK